MFKVSRKGIRILLFSRYLTHLIQQIFYYIPRKHQKTSVVVGGFFLLVFFFCIYGIKKETNRMKLVKLEQNLFLGHWNGALHQLFLEF